MVRGLRFRRGRRETLVRLCVQLNQEGGGVITCSSVYASSKADGLTIGCHSQGNTRRYIFLVWAEPSITLCLAEEPMKECVVAVVVHWGRKGVASTGGRRRDERRSFLAGLIFLPPWTTRRSLPDLTLRLTRCLGSFSGLR